MKFTPIILAVVIILLSPQNVAAQADGFVLLDAENNLPIRGSFFQTSNQRYGTTDEQGRGKLTRFDETVLISFSHLAYRDSTFEMTAVQDTFYLTPLVLELPEINVSSRKARRIKSPQKLLRQALRKVAQNYPTVRQSRTATYRELLQREADLVQLNEALVEVETSPYGEKHRHRKAWSKGWERNVFRPHRLNGKFRYLGVHFPEGTQQYSALNDRYRVINSRISIGPEPDNYYHRLAGGPLALVRLDKVRLGYDYLDANGLKDYDYELVDTVEVNGAYCYHLRFQPSNQKPTKYFALSKTQPTGVFTGDIFITLSDLSIVRFSATNTKAIIVNYGKPPQLYLPPTFARTEVNYARSSLKKWRLDQVVSTARSLVDTTLTATRVLSFTESKIAGQDTGRPSNWVYHDYSTTLRSLTHRYDPNFWNAFSQSSIYRETDKLTSSLVDTKVFPETYFFAPFQFDTVGIPRAIPTRTHKYINPKRIKDAFAWLADLSDSATTKYLNWENDYYDQFFRQHPVLFDSVSVQFTGEVQGWAAPTPIQAGVVDTMLTKVKHVWGFYRIVGGTDTTLLLSTGAPKDGYATTDYGWTKSGDNFYVLYTNRTYDQRISVYQSSGLITEGGELDDYHWRGDTLYVTENNARLRTAKFSRWTESQGWEELLQESEPTFEYRLQVLPDGELILLRESLTTAYVFRQSGNEWLMEPTPYPALLAGSGGRGRGCHAEIEADYIADCRETVHGTCVLAVDSARHEIWLQAAGTANWRRVDFPQGQLYASFGQGFAGEIILETEGVGSYGKKYRVDFAKLCLVPVATDYLPIDLPGYRDSIVWVPAADGVSIPCQLRWKASWTSALKSTVLKVYAAYGNPYLVGHNEADIAMMNLGHAVVYVHARGGGARGPFWYDAGRAKNKLTPCTDYLAAVRYFNEYHPLQPTPLAGYAQSAGGPILGYAVNNVPELLQAVVFDHAYLDVVGTMSRPELPLTEYEYTEWGNPADKKIREVQTAYSPYQNIRLQAYPAMYFIAGRYDQSTPYWQIAKYVAAVRKANQGDAPIVLHTAMRGSHPGTPFGPGRQKLIEQLVFLMAEMPDAR